MSYRERNGLGHDTEPKPSKASVWWRAKREVQSPDNIDYAGQRRPERAAADLAEKAADREGAAESATVLILEAPVPV
jgi:hypothetical protein